MHKRISASIGLLIVGVLYSCLLQAQSLREQADSQFQAGNFRAAFEFYQRLFQQDDYDGIRAPQDLSRAVHCLQEIGEFERFDGFIESIVADHKNQWKVLQAAAHQYKTSLSWGYLIGGEFKRGYQRGAQGRYVDASERDRIRALQLLRDAIELFEIEANGNNRDLGDLYYAMADNMVIPGQLWRLQVLSDLDRLPDFDERNYSFGYGAPVDSEGNIITYAVPASFDAAVNDGERLRFLLSQAGRHAQEGDQKHLWLWAELLWQQFGVHTINRYGNFRFDEESGLADRAQSLLDLENLKDNETIAQLANGVRRFEFPTDYNFIEIYQQLAQDGVYADQSLTRLATIFENRGQLPRAADYWQESIQRFGPGVRDHKQDRLDQIVGAWAYFERMPEGRHQSLTLRYRNATNVRIKIHELKADLLVRKIKENLNNATIDYHPYSLQLNRIGYQVVAEDKKEYLGELQHIWSQSLLPAPDHRDSRVEIPLPDGLMGPYLVEASVAGGNTSFIVVWNNDSIIVKKPLHDSTFFYLADADTGAAMANKALHFFGFQFNYVTNRDVDNQTQQYNVQTKQFTRTTDARGQLIIDQNEFDNRYQWLIHTDSDGDNNRGFAGLGFNRMWTRGYHNQRGGQMAAYVLTNQPVYRPGQEVKIKSWLRHASYAEVDENQYADRPVTVKISNPKGEEIWSKSLTTDAYGGVDLAMTLDEAADLGMYWIQIDGINGNGSFRVEEYKKPEFEVTIETPGKAQRLGGKIEVAVNANYYFGAPVTDARVKVKVQRYDHSNNWYPAMPWDWLYGSGYWWFAYDSTWHPGWQQWGWRAPQHSWRRYSNNRPELIQDIELQLDQNGRALLEIDTAQALELYGDKDHRYEITAEVTDRSRRTIVGNGEVLVARKPFQVFAWLDRGYYRTGETVRANFAAQTLDQQPIEGKGSVKLFRLTFDKNTSNGNNAPGDNSVDDNMEAKETLVQTWSLDTNAEGQARMALSADRAGQYRLSYTVDDENNNVVEGSYIFNVIGGRNSSPSTTDNTNFRFGALELIADKAHYAPGEQVRLLVNSERRDARVLLFLHSDDSRDQIPENIILDGNSLIKTIAIEQRDMPNLFVEALSVFDGRVHSEVKEIVVPPEQKMLNVEVLGNKDKYTPGETAELTVKLTDAQGKAFVGSTVVAVYDKALDYIAGANPYPDIKQFFWSWRRYFFPQLEHSAQKQLGNISKPNDKVMQRVGIFGDELPLNRNFGNALEEIVVTGSRIGRADADFAVTVAEPEPQAAPQAMLNALPESKSEQGRMLLAVADSSFNVPALDIRTEFVDSPLWEDNVTTNRRGIAKVKFTMPDNLTTWLTKVWALGEGTRVGQARSELITSKNLLLRLQAPRFFVEKDEVVLSANIHNYLESAEKIRVILQSDGEQLDLLGDSEQQIQVEAGGEQRVDWRVKVRREGQAEIRMLALGENESDAVQMQFPVYIHGMLKTQSFSGALDREQSEGRIEFTIPERRRPEQTRLELRYSPSLAGAMVDALPYLADYPYGCTEQTLSRFLPTVITQRVLLQSGFNLQAIKAARTDLNAQHIGDRNARIEQRLEEERKRSSREINPVFDEGEVNKMASAGLQRLAEMQLQDGGWGWFSGWREQSSAHTTAHVVHGLQMARDTGLNVEAGILRRGLDWLMHYQAQEIKKLENAESKTEPFKSSADNVDAFIAMVLSDAEDGDATNNNAMLDFLYRDRTRLSVYGKALLALALHSQGREQQRDQVRQNIEQYLVRDDENQTAYLNLNNQGYWWYWYGSEFEAHAYYLKLLAKTDPHGDIAPRLVKYLLNNRRHGNYWNSTRDTALVVEAMADYLVASEEIAPELNLEILVDGEVVKTLSIEQDNLFSFDNALVLERSDLGAGQHRITLRKRGASPLYYNAYLSNFSLEDKLTRAGLEIKVERQFYRLQREDGSTLKQAVNGQAVQQAGENYRRIPITDDTELNSGDLVEIELLLESKNDYEYILLEDMKAAGFEPVDVRSGYTDNELGAYVEFRDNRVAFFVSHLARGKHSISYRMRAETPGRFSALPTRVEAMYAPELKANSDEMQLSIADVSSE